MQSVGRTSPIRALLACYMTTLGMFAALANRWLLRGFADPDDIPTRAPTTASLRKLVQLVLITDSDLDAFCLDHFPELRRRFAYGMDRTQKLNILLEQADPLLVLVCLGEDHPHQLSRYLHVLRYGR